MLSQKVPAYTFEGYKEPKGAEFVVRNSQFEGQATASILLTVKLKPFESFSPILPMTHLSNREQVVLQLLIEEESAKPMVISPYTLADHLKVIYIKLGVKSSTQAAMVALTKLAMRPR